MSLSLGSIGIHRQGLFLRSLRHAMSLEERTDKESFYAADLSRIHTYVGKDFFTRWFVSSGQKFCVSGYVRCTDEDRTGFSLGDDRVRIFSVEGFKTFDGAFGFLTEQVDQAQTAYKSSRFRYYPEPELNSTLSDISRIYEYEGLRQQWKPLSYSFKCHRCGTGFSGDGFVMAECPICNVAMVMELR